MSQAKDLNAELLAWISAHETDAAHPWKAISLDIARKLARHEGMALAWGELAKYEAEVGVIVYMIQFALQKARDEAVRPKVTDEAKFHAELLAAIEGLQAAIAHVPMVSSYGSPDNRIVGARAFHWRRRDVPSRYAPPDFVPDPTEDICLEDVLDFALKSARVTVCAMAARPRSVERQRVRPEINAFLVCLAEGFERQFGNKLYGTLAHIISAVFEIEFSKAQVVGVLRPRCNNSKNTGDKPT